MGHSAAVSSCYDLSEVEILGKPERRVGLWVFAGLRDLELGGVNCKCGWDTKQEFLLIVLVVKESKLISVSLQCT